ncbi:aspartate kinase [Streptomyces sp. NPDC088785]|uniref:amino acid kinase family protein n=1 Tax=Streptomyces sp. NPDC088785 TaxID=3365897 RepID=UPI003828203D
MADPHVLKFGGSSFPDAAGFRRVARHLAERVRAGQRLVVVVSGMPGSTEQLRELVTEAAPDAGAPVAGGAITLADSQGAALLRAAAVDAGLRAGALFGGAIGLRQTTTAVDSIHVDPRGLEETLRNHDLVVVPGGQGAGAGEDPRYLGKNTSDLSAVLLAAALRRDECEIYSDVEGVYSADPRLVDDARLLERVSWERALLCAEHGAKVLHPQAVRAARHSGTTLVCRLNRDDFRVGSRIGRDGSPPLVVLDHRSTVIELPGAYDVHTVRSHLASQGLNLVVPRVRDRPLVVVTGGYFDVPRFLEGRGLPGRITGERLVTLVDDEVRHLLARDERQALEWAREAHADLILARTPPGPPAPPGPAAPTTA